MVLEKKNSSANAFLFSYKKRNTAFSLEKKIILRTDLSKKRKVPDKMKGAKSHKKNISQTEFSTRIMRNSVTHFTLKSYLPHTLLQNHGTVHIFLPSVPSLHIIHRLEISFLQLVEHSRS